MTYNANRDRYNDMLYNSCGNSGLKVPAISFGMWNNFGHNQSFENARAMIRQSFDLGITYFDLANGYGPPGGAAEEMFAKVFAQDLVNYRDEIIITTKAGHKMHEGPYGKGGSRKHLFASIDNSLKRLGVDYVDVFFSHVYDQETPLEETMSALDAIVKQGKASYIGFSTGYDILQMKEATAILKRLGTPCLVRMSPYSMFNRGLEKGLQGLLDEEGVGFVAFSPLAEGLLTERYIHGIPEDSRYAKGEGMIAKKPFPEDKIERVKKLYSIAFQRGQTLSQMALAWVLREGRVCSALIGASRVGQIQENVKALENLNFTEEELNAIDQILA